MFGRNNDNNDGGAEQSQQPMISLPDLIEYTVKLLHGKGEEKVVGHLAQTPDSGGLNILRAVFVDEGCTQPGTVVAAFYAPGMWFSVKADYVGYERQSALAIH